MYSELFCGLVGKDGTVVAFEPFPESCQSIRERLPDCQWLRVECVALSDVDTQGMLAMGDQSVQHHIATEAESAGATTASVPVVICRADTLSQRLGQVPNVIKVDVEGFEEEVLNGMGDLLTSSRLRSILTEVHFAKLEKRGRLTAPNRIETLLKKNGFTTKWVDSSHLLATR
jgi:FkbM family methyltransferase